MRALFNVTLTLAALTTLVESVRGFELTERSMQSAVDVLENETPHVVWDKKISSMADVTCDGVRDVIVIGTEKENAWIAVVPGSGSKLAQPTTRIFPIGTHTQSSFCARPVRIETYDLLCETEEGMLPGCTLNKNCKAFIVADDECDSFHFYWNSKEDSLAWWRH